jgi:FkbM family methyltransferase
VLIEGRDPIDRSNYDLFYALDWNECPRSFEDCPSTKAEHCLADVFGLRPIPRLCRYTIGPSPNSTEQAATWLRSVCNTGPDSNGRFPAVLIHYQGNTSSDHKNLPHETIRAVCNDILDAGAVPVILDWDKRSPLPDGVRIHNPGTQVGLWGGTGTGDAGALAALIEQSALMIGIDSGPLHVAGACTTPTIAVWTGHHPLHYFGHAPNVLHLVPPNHKTLLRGDRAVGESYFEKCYRFRVFSDLTADLRRTVRELLPGDPGRLVHRRSFWVRADNVAQDLVVVEDIAEQDSYRVCDLPLPRPVVVDVGAHIGVFSATVHRRYPGARIIAVECCPENIAALERNVSHFAEVVQAAVTYEEDVALLNAVYSDCVSTGGSVVLPRTAVRAKAEAERGESGARSVLDGYWADVRPLPTVTLEELVETRGLNGIDLLKLDCEGSEFSILENSTMIDRIGLIVGEYHGRERFVDLVRRRFENWILKIIRDGDPGTFWLIPPGGPRW